jgi:glucan phosphoethanolaminetransferase (alkaline phosphatase superfamily)
LSLLRDVIFDLKQIDQNPKVMRKFGLLLGILFYLFSIVIWFKHRHEVPPLTTSTIVFLCLGTISILLAVLFPKALKPLNTIMVFIAMIIGWIMTRVILALMFYCVFTPIGFVMKLAGKDSMRRKFQTDIQSYWIDRSEIPYDPERSKRLF